jgi:hypothetical protein
MLRNIGCKPFVGFALQGRDAMRHPKRGPSFVSQQRLQVKYLKFGFFCTNVYKGNVKESSFKPHYGACANPISVNMTRSFGPGVSPCFFYFKKIRQSWQSTILGRHKKFKHILQNRQTMWDVGS